VGWSVRDGILASVSFLETDIKELFELIVDKPEEFKSIPVECRDEIISWWNVNVNESASIISKYQKMLK
jgi:hypothetical protein